VARDTLDVAATNVSAGSKVQVPAALKTVSCLDMAASKTFDMLALPSVICHR
jgi:hypothetical protein